jgi:hypothetical protein
MITSTSLLLGRLDQISGHQAGSSPKTSSVSTSSASSPQTGLGSAAQPGFPALGAVILGKADGDENAAGGEQNDGDADDMPAQQQQQPVTPTFDEAGAYGFGAIYA